MANKIRLYFTYDLGKPLPWALINNELGRSKRQQLSYKDLFTKALQKLKFPKKLSLSQKIDYLINEFSKSSNVEIIQKSLLSKNFSNFVRIDSNDQDHKNKWAIRNVAFIARLSQNLENNDKNAIVLVFDFLKEKVDTNGVEKLIFYLRLVSIDVSFLQPLNYKHSNVFQTNGVEFIKLDKENVLHNEELTIEKQLRELAKLRELKKAIDIFDDEDDSLKLKEMKEFIFSYHKFLQTKETEKFNLYFVTKNDEQFLNLQEQKNFDALIKTNDSNKIGELDKRREWIVSREDNYADKMAVRIVSYEELNIGTEIDDQIELFKIKITTNKVKLDVNSKNIEKQRLKRAKIKQECDNLEEKANSKSERLESSENKVVEHQKQIAELENKLSSLKKKPKLFSWKINRNKLESTNEEINQVKQKKLEITNIKNTNNELILTLKKQISKIKEMLGVQKLQQQKITDSIAKFENECQSLRDDNQRNEKQVNELQIQREKETSEKKHYFKVKLGTSRKNQHSQFKKEMKVEAFSRLDFITDRKCLTQMSDFDIGTFMVFKRWKATFFNYIDGFYKSPYALLSLNRPEVPIEIKGDVKVSAIKLNKLQQEAVNSIYFSHFSSFLQGPPGTGKTQVISAVALNTIKNNESMLISSSTNEAINNAFDRIFEDARDPNLLMLRVSNSEEHKQNALQYSSNLLYKNFINKIGAFVNPFSSDLEDKNIENLENVIATKPKLAKDYISPFPLDAKGVKAMQEADKSELKKKFGYEEEDFSYIDIDLKHKREKIERKYKNNIEEIDNLIKKLHKTLKFSFADNLKSYYKKLWKIKKDKNSKNSFNQAIEKINKQVNQENKGYKFEQFTSNFQEISQKFALECFSHNAINVIGITTTSNLKVGIANSEDQKDLFTEYPIDVAVIDEISKSITPEILSISQLAKKFIFAGDYRQLPPMIDLDEKSVLEFYDWHLKNSKTKLKIAKDDYYEHISSLFATSLFENQVAKMKRENNARQQNSYVALKEQYRFDENINTLVNLTYQDDEKLRTYFNEDKFPQHFQKYKLGTKIKRSNSIIAIDTSTLTSDFISKVGGKASISSNDAFDSNYSLLSQLEYLAMINDFNAYVIKNVITNLHTNNPDLDFSNVGVITMTRSQANLIKWLLREEKSLNRKVQSVQVNTVDNFQGREKTIIILDLVRAKGKLIKKDKKIHITIPRSRNVEFYKSPERINVSVSRAKNKLVIVGALEYLSKAIECKIKILGDELRKDKPLHIFKAWSKIIAEQEGLLSWDKF